MTIVRAFDLSFPSAKDPVSPRWFELMRSMGYELAIVGLHGGVTVNAAARTWMAWARDAGLDIAAYIAITRRGSADTVYNESRQAAGDMYDAAIFVAVDLEDVWDEIITPDDAWQLIRRIEADGKQPVIYSAYWWWSRYWPSVTDFASYPLWDAYYDDRDDVELRIPYGGWVSCVGKQYNGTAKIAGVKVDLNVFDKAFVESCKAKQEDTVDRYEELREAYDQCTARFTELWNAMGRWPERVFPDEWRNVAEAYGRLGRAVRAVLSASSHASGSS